jgi:hypothetical protein
VGTEQDTIFIRSDGESGQKADWCGITLGRGSVCELAYTTVTDAYKSLWAVDPRACEIHDATFLNQDVIAVHLQSCDDTTSVRRCLMSGGNTGIRADTCHTIVSDNTIESAGTYGIYVSHDLGSRVASNEITISGLGLVSSRSGIYVSNTDSLLHVVGNDVSTGSDTRATGISCYRFRNAAAVVDSNECGGAVSSTGVSKGIRFQYSNPQARWNELYDYRHTFDVFASAVDAVFPDLGRAGVENGSNSADTNAYMFVHVLISGRTDSLYAQNNWWGTDNPDSSKFSPVVQWNPYLGESPRTRSSEEEQPNSEPARYVLDQNFPNPLNPATTIRYALAEPGHVRLRIHDLSGRIVRTLVDAEMPAGHHSAVWGGANDAGDQVSSGVYFYTADCGGFVETRKLVVLR